MALLSADTARKQAAAHPEITADEYALAQTVVDGHTAAVRDGTSLIYVMDTSEREAGGHVLVVKATSTGKALWVTSFRRLSRKEAVRDSEIRRLIKKSGK